MLKLEIKTKDPFEILASTRDVLKDATFVTIDEKALSETAEKIETYLNEHKQFPDQGHDMIGDVEKDLQLTFFEICSGFCFWALPGQPKWGIELDDGTKEDGWYGVCMAFKRAYDEGVNVTDPDFYINASDDEIKHIFRSATDANIPLLNERVFILRENAQLLKDRFDGKVSNMISAVEGDAVKFVQLTLDTFPSFNDRDMYNKKEVIFLKLLHLFALDLNLRFDKPFLTKNIDQLAVFADYKLPQLLRMFGVLQYSKELATKVDAYDEIAQGSKEEIEMRAGAIWGVELLRQALAAQGHERTSMEVGHVIWLMSQDQSLQKRIKPYHRTYTIYY